MRSSLVFLAVFAPVLAFAAEPEFTITLRDHRFDPVEVHVPSGQRVKLIVDNQDPTPEEFESKVLKKEKVIPGKSKATILIGPLRPGRYPFVGEFNEKTAQGAIVAD